MDRTQMAERAAATIRAVAKGRAKAIASMLNASGSLGGLGANIDIFIPDDIDRVVKALNVAKWEIKQLWTDEHLKWVIRTLRAKNWDAEAAGMVTFQQSLDQSPEEVAKEVFVTGVVDDVKQIAVKGSEVAKGVFKGLGDIAKWLPMIAVAVGSLIVYRYATAPARLITR